MSDDIDRIKNESWLNLGKEEEVLWWGNPSIIPYLPMFIIFSLAIPASGIAYYYTPIGVEVFAAIPIALALIGYEYLKIRRTFYVVTDEQTAYKIGIISRDTMDIPYHKVQHVSFSQDIPGRLLNYGDIIITTAGTSKDEKVFNNCPNPAHVKQELMEAKQQYMQGSRSQNNTPLDQDQQHE